MNIDFTVKKIQVYMPKFCEEVKQSQHINQKSSITPKANHSEFGSPL